MKLYKIKSLYPNCHESRPYSLTTAGKAGPNIYELSIKVATVFEAMLISNFNSNKSYIY